MADARPILITGTAGFIGFHLAERLLAAGRSVVGVDNFNDYYDVSLKEARQVKLMASPAFTGVRGDICDAKLVDGIFDEHGPTVVIHLAAQAGVRYSLDHPFAYLKANLEGFLVMLEAARHRGVERFIYASSWSVYGGNTKLPFSEDDPVGTPVSLYAATKRAEN